MAPGEEQTPGPLAELIVEQAPEAMIFADAQGLIRHWNPAATAIFGFPAAEALGSSLDLLIPEHLRAAHWRGFQAALAAGATQHRGRALMTRSLHKDGRRLYVEMSFAVLKGRDGRALGALAVARDATERYLQEKQLQERLRALETPPHQDSRSTPTT